MPYYLFRGSYTAEAWAGLIKKPQNRTEIVRSAIESLGGTLEGAWLSFGEDDVVAICNMPDNVSAAAFSLAVAAGGAHARHHDHGTGWPPPAGGRPRRATGAGSTSRWTATPRR